MAAFAKKKLFFCPKNGSADRNVPLPARFYFFSLPVAGLDKIEYLQNHDSDAIYQAAHRIIDRYFSSTQDVSPHSTMEPRPSQDGRSFVFSSGLPPPGNLQLWTSTLPRSKSLQSTSFFCTISWNDRFPNRVCHWLYLNYLSDFCQSFFFSTQLTASRISTWHTFPPFSNQNCHVVPVLPTRSCHFVCRMKCLRFWWWKLFAHMALAVAQDFNRTRLMLSDLCLMSIMFTATS